MSTALDGSRYGTGGISTSPAPSRPRDDRPLPRLDLDLERELWPEDAEDPDGPDHGADADEPDGPDHPEGADRPEGGADPAGPEPGAWAAAVAADIPQVSQ